MAGWSAGLIKVCHASLSGHSVLVAGLGFSVPGNPGSDVEFLLPARTPDALQRVWVTVSPAGEEKEYIAICRHLLPWMKVAVRAAKQDARSVHFRLDRARSSVHTEISQAGLRA
jgi:hypothetical protein